MQAQCVRAVGRCAVEGVGVGGGAASLSTEQLAEAAKALKQLLEDSNQRLVSIVGGEGYDDDDEGEEEDSRHAEDEEAIEAEEDLLEQIIYTVGKLLETQGEGAVARRWLVPVTADGHICHDGQWARAIVCCVDESECPYACQ